jgi:hypothetical protein
MLGHTVLTMEDPGESPEQREERLSRRPRMVIVSKAGMVRRTVVASGSVANTGICLGAIGVLGVFMKMPGHVVENIPRVFHAF